MGCSIKSRLEWIGHLCITLAAYFFVEILSEILELCKKKCVYVHPKESFSSWNCIEY